MKHCILPLLLCLGAPGCSLITVPVKTAGSIVTTTVKTTGDIVTAPFDAMAGRRAAPEPETTKQEQVRKPQNSYLEERPAVPVDE